MAQLQIVYLLRPGTQEQWRRLYQEIAESRREEFEASCRRMGITQVLVRLVQLLHGDLMLVTLHTQEPQQTLQELATAERPLERWLRAQLQDLLGWNVQDVVNGLPDPQGDLIFTWGP
jgi:LmbE family N-acetylglucosaminyl deacetylase